jgi:isochorismate hydrolase
MRLIKDSAIAIVVDMQERLFPVIYQNELVERNILLLIQGLKLLDVPVMVTEQYKKGLGATISSVELLVSSDLHIEKSSFSCCDEPQFAEALAVSKKRVVILAGVESHICLMQTAIDLNAEGFVAVVVEDCVSSRTAENKRIAMDRLRQEGVIVTSCESLLFELCRFASGDAFKGISKLVK